MNEDGLRGHCMSLVTQRTKLNEHSLVASRHCDLDLAAIQLSFSVWETRSSQAGYTLRCTIHMIKFYLKPMTSEIYLYLDVLSPGNLRCGS